MAASISYLLVPLFTTTRRTLRDQQRWLVVEEEGMRWMIVEGLRKKEKRRVCRVFRKKHRDERRNERSREEEIRIVTIRHSKG